MIENLKDIKEKDIWSYPLCSILDIVSKLEEVKPHNYDRIGALEDLSYYCGLISAIELRVEQNKIEELIGPDKISERNDLSKRLNNLKNDFTSIVNIYSFYQKRIDEFTAEIDDRISRIEEQVNAASDSARERALTAIGEYQNNIQNELDKHQAKTTDDISKHKETIESELDAHKNSIEQEIEKSKTDTQNKIASSEHGLLTHMITMMGVFSAIITIVMSLVLTSSSWLNNADGASALLAFIVPTFIVLLSISFLMLIIYAYNTSDVFLINQQDEQQRKKRTYYIIFFSVLIAIIVLLGVFLWNTVLRHTGKESELIHSRYVLSPGEYIIENSSDNEESCFIFQIEGKEYVFAYDEAYEHDGNLFFCSEHSKLE